MCWKYHHLVLYRGLSSAPSLEVLRFFHHRKMITVLELVALLLGLLYASDFSNLYVHCFLKLKCCPSGRLLDAAPC